MDKRVLTSRQNKTIKRYFKILERPEKFSPHGDTLEGEVVIEGPRVLSMALDSRAKIVNAVVTEEFLRQDKFHHIMDGLLSKGIPVNMVDEKLMKELSQTKTPQGIMALCRVRAYSISDIKDITDGFIVVSDGLQDPGNMGTLIRATDAAGIMYFISLKGSISPYNPKTIRASAGSVFNIGIVLGTVESFIEWKRGNGIPLIITEPGAERTIYDYIPTGREAFVFGNETRGVSDMIKREASQSFRIPIYGKAESLNVAMAGSIILYEMVRRQRFARSTAYKKNDPVG